MDMDCFFYQNVITCTMVFNRAVKRIFNNNTNLLILLNKNKEDIQIKVLTSFKYNKLFNN